MYIKVEIVILLENVGVIFSIYGIMSDMYFSKRCINNFWFKVYYKNEKRIFNENKIQAYA